MSVAVAAGALRTPSARTAPEGAGGDSPALDSVGGTP